MVAVFASISNSVYLSYRQFQIQFLMLVVYVILFILAGCSASGECSSEDPFDDIDTNNDGWISESEYAANGPPEPTFSALDSNGDGFISREEWLALP